MGPLRPSPVNGRRGIQLRRLPRIRRDLHPDDPVRILDRAAAARALLDRVDMLHAGDDLAPDRVLAVEMRRRRKTDEELAVGTVRVGGPRHRAGAADMLLVAELGGELSARAAGAVAARIAGLRHEAGDDAVKRDAVVKAGARQLLDAVDMARRQIGPQGDDDAPGGHIEIDRVFGAGGAHRFDPFRLRPARLSHSGTIASKRGPIWRRAMSTASR